ncbi:MAG: 4Fe-4S binding protein [Spirochaetaceae bacterium]|nr:4Fe-4S binding protein [Spirochaetaceae bacterium]
MKKIAVQDISACMNCLTCENVCAQAFYKNECFVAENLSCIHVKAGKEGKIKIVSCVQCGKCGEVCDQKAITQNAKGVYLIDKKACNGCGKCVEACPFNLIVKSKKAEKPTKCIACGICAKSCPQNVLYIKEDAA